MQFGVEDLHVLEVSLLPARASWVSLAFPHGCSLTLILTLIGPRTAAGRGFERNGRRRVGVYVAVGDEKAMRPVSCQAFTRGRIASPYHIHSIVVCIGGSPV